jgi:fucose permease
LLSLSVQENYANFIVTYGINIAHFTPQNSAILNSCFWICFALGRLASIPISHYWSPTKILLASLAGSLFFMFIMIFGPNAGGLFTFITLCFGFTTSAVYPCSVAWAESYLRITGKILSIILMFDCIGSSTLPLMMVRIKMRMKSALAQAQYAH